MTAQAEDPHAGLREQGEPPIPLFVVGYRHWAVIVHPRCYVNPLGHALPDRGWRLHPLYLDWPQPALGTVQAIAEDVNGRFCFNCAAPLGYRLPEGANPRLGLEWWPLHLLDDETTGEVTVACPTCAFPF